MKSMLKLILLLTATPSLANQVNDLYRYRIEGMEVRYIGRTDTTYSERKNDWNDILDPRGLIDDWIPKPVHCDQDLRSRARNYCREHGGQFIPQSLHYGQAKKSTETFWSTRPGVWARTEALTSRVHYCTVPISFSCGGALQGEIPSEAAWHKLEVEMKDAPLLDAINALSDAWMSADATGTERPRRPYSGKLDLFAGLVRLAEIGFFSSTDLEQGDAIMEIAAAIQRDGAEAWQVARKASADYEAGLADLGTPEISRICSWDGWNNFYDDEFTKSEVEAYIDDPNRTYEQRSGNVIRHIRRGGTYESTVDEFINKKILSHCRYTLRNYALLRNVLRVYMVDTSGGVNSKLLDELTLPILASAFTNFRTFGYIGQPGLEQLGERLALRMNAFAEVHYAARGLRLDYSPGRYLLVQNHFAGSDYTQDLARDLGLRWQRFSY